jgi:hypothetical protein
MPRICSKEGVLRLESLERLKSPLAKALPVLAADVMRTQLCVRHGLRLGVIAILHLFNGRI